MNQAPHVPPTEPRDAPAADGPAEPNSPPQSLDELVVWLRNLLVAKKEARRARVERDRDIPCFRTVAW